MTLRLPFISCVALVLVACGSSNGSSDGGGCAVTPSRNPEPGEGTLCTPVDGGGPSNCADGLSCADWSPYASSFDVCRIPCGQGCPTGETCSQDQGGTTTQSCQCTPAEAPCGTGDSCASIGLECDPYFHVCLAPVSSTSCTSPLSYSKLWQLCLADG
jgi:hypothetical protein